MGADVNHAERAHATWSASSTSRNWACAGALALSEPVAHLDTESEAAAWGTACHEVSELCLTNGQDAEEFIDRNIKTKEFTMTVDDEMATTAQEYIDYVREQYGSHKDNVLIIEERFSLESLNPPFDAGGTGDAVIYFPHQKLLEIIDLKGGRGVVVEVNENKQTRTYGLGGLLTHPEWEVTHVKSTIVQPRAPHKDGRTRSETIGVFDLMDWTSELRERMDAAAAAMREYKKLTGEISKEAWAEKYLEAGDHCTFCPAAGFCPKLKKRALDAAGVWFDDMDEPKLSNMPDELDAAQLAKVLDAADMIQGYLTACRSLAHKLADTGVEIPDYVFVEKIGNRRFRAKDDVEALKLELFLSADLTDDDIFDKKLRSPAQIEKVLGVKRKKLIEGLIERPITGKNLVRQDKTTRETIKPAVHKHFDVLD